MAAYLLFSPPLLCFAFLGCLGCYSAAFSSASDCISSDLVQPSPAPPWPFSAAVQLLSPLIQPCGLKLGAVGCALAGCAEW